MTPVVLLALALVASLIVVLVRHLRARRLARWRAGWGKAVERKRRLDAIEASHRSRLASTTSTDTLDDRTWDDLDLDDVFAVLDRTVSTLGQHALYHRLRTAPAPESPEAFEALVERLRSDAAARERAWQALAGLQDPHGYDVWWLAAADAIDTRPWHVAFPLLSAATLLLAALAWFQPAVLPILIALVIANVAVRYATDRRVALAAAALRQVAPVIATGQRLAFLDGDDVRPLIGALRSDAPALRRLKTLARWISGDPFMLSVRPGSFAVLLNDVVSLVYEYLNLALLLDATGVYIGARQLRTRGPAFLRVVAAAGEVDVAISVASYRAGRADWTQPRFTPPGSTALFTDVAHPLIDNAVPNTLALEAGEGALVTGSNMSGKSTFLRTVGVAAVMGQTINTCLAAGYQAPVLRVRSCIGRADDLLAGKSYYIAEVEALLDLVAASRGASPHLFLLDELFRGTNAVERIAAGQAVLRELVAGATGRATHIAIAATHDAELVDLLAGVYAPLHFGDAVTDEGLTFDHRLKPGRATTRNAIALLRLHGAPASLIDRALEVAAELDRQRGTTITSR